MAPRPGQPLRPDYRERCEQGHLICEDCSRCACSDDVSGRVSTDRSRIYAEHEKATLCPDCRYDRALPV